MARTDVNSHEETFSVPGSGRARLTAGGGIGALGVASPRNLGAAWLASAPRCQVENQTGVSVDHGELDAGGGQGLLDLAQTIHVCFELAVWPFDPLHGRDVDAGPLGQLLRGPAEKGTAGSNLPGNQHRHAILHQFLAILPEIY